jgi:hypothetical protein
VKRALSLGAALLCVSPIAAAPTETPTPGPRTTPESTSAPRPVLRLSADRHVEAMLDQEARPRFETTIDVVGRTHEEAWRAHARGFELECGAPPSGAPTHLEMREMRRVRPGPYLDYLAIARAIRDAVRRAGPDRYFVYRIHTPRGPTYVVQEGRIPAPALYAPGATYELLDAFPDKESAVFYWKQLERGDKGRAPSDAAPPPPWLTSNCRPGRR